MSTEDQNEPLQGDSQTQFTEDQIQNMIDYISNHSDYKVVTNAEYQMLNPLAQSSPGMLGGAIPRTQHVKFEAHSQPQASNMHTSYVCDPKVYRPRFPNFSGEEKSETSFEVWKHDVECALRDDNCVESVILQAMRSSLKGKARNLLLTLPTDASPQSIVHKLEGIYGNIYPSEKLIQQFYAAKQEVGESVADYGMRLESLLQTCIDRGSISFSDRNEMLRNKLWSGLRDDSLRNASRYKYDTVSDFEALRMELRTIELDMSTASAASMSKKTQVAKVSEKSDEANTLSAIFKKLEEMNRRISDIEQEVRSKDGQPRNNFTRGMGSHSFRGQGQRGRNMQRGDSGRGSRGYRSSTRGYPRGVGFSANRGQRQYDK
ncbi:hypothetical protein FSP39_005531 [Pinctada imbricata]|uniref:Paraneoplastic antigen Ma-like C-terminal domain-containing protein n=1 Tax=Pinctada imbricata TaxID=66713 RepID=A0AA88YWX5_PINIB|nr:hypothetical protein FSP39_005531 [Pinctada imbricata]